MYFPGGLKINMKHDFYNSICHICIGAFVSWGVTMIIYSQYIYIPLSGLLSGLSVGLAIEINQFLKQDGYELKIVDRLFDLLGYIIGAGSIYVLGVNI